MKRFNLWLAAAFLAVALAACGGEDTTTTDVQDVTQPDNPATDDGAPDLGQPDNVEPDTGTDVPAGPDTVEDTPEEIADDVPPTDAGQDAVAEVEDDVPAGDEGGTDQGGTDTVEPATEFELLIAFLEGDGGNYMNNKFPKVIEGTDVMAEGLDAYKIIDVRNEDKHGPDQYGVWQKGANGTTDFVDGHIAGAVNVPLPGLLDYVKANVAKTDKVLVVCATGQLAGIAVTALNLLGYDAYSLKWGMSAWNANFDLWSGATSSSYADGFVKTADEGKAEAGDYPALETGFETAAEILEARVAAVLAGAPKIVTVADLMAAPEDFYIVNYWPEAEYLEPGHVPGAHQYTPKVDLATAKFLATLPTDKKIAVYCYTGQQSAQVMTFLNVLGYDAYSIKFGTNAMIYDQMTKQKWPGPVNGPKGYAFEPVPVVKEFELLVDHVEGVGGNYLNSAAAPKVVAAVDVVAEGLENWTILDVRTEDKYGKDGMGEWKMAPNGRKDFDDGHITGAVLVPLKDIATYAKTYLAKDQKILVVCHTGQNAGHAVLALNLMGYDAWSLKWGMSSWHKDFDLWSTFTGSAYAVQFVKDADPGKDASGAYPTLSTGKTTAEAILEDRIAGVLAAPRFMSATDLFSAPEEFYVVNYWPNAEYLEPGHVPGAHQYTPKVDLITSGALSTLPIDRKIAVYCYTGQNSSQVASYLAILGYDAWSVKFGTNAMIYDQMPKQKWPGAATGPGAYTYEETPVM